MAVVVTGAAGFIGARLAGTLKDRGYDVVAIDRRLGVSVPWLTGDLADPTDEIRDALRDADAVFHLAGRPGVRERGPEVERARWRDNVLTTDAVLDATPTDVPLVVASSSSVYGGALSDGGVVASVEDGPLRPGGGYARSKAAAEALCAERGGVCVVRPFTVAGPGQRPDMALSRWIAAARRGDPLVVYGSVERRRDVTDVDDVVEGMIRAAEVGVTATLNLGTGIARSLAEMIEAVRAAVGPLEVRVVDPMPGEPDVTLADTTRCIELLGFAPRTDLASLVRRQVEHDILEVV